MSLKRRRSEDFLLANEPTDFNIITADSELPLEAHLIVLLPCSRLVRDLPRDTSGKTSWDLSKLVLEGHSSPVPSAVVRQWLDHLYSRIDISRQAPTFPSLSEDGRSLLLFADAVGTSTAIMRALCEALTSQPGLTLPVVVNGAGGGAAAGGDGADAAAPPPPPPLQLDLVLRGKLYYLLAGEMRVLTVPYSGPQQVVVASADFVPYKDALPGAMAAALESWLYLAGRVGLVALLRLLLNFFQSHLLPGQASLLLNSTAQVFSRRVLECMPHELLVEGFVSERLWGPQLGLADVPASNQLTLIMRSPHAATWFGLGPESKLTGDAMCQQNVFHKGANSNVLRVSVGGLTPEQHQQAVRAVMGQLEGEEGARGAAARRQ
ncbi:hypothetical protein HYH02_007332 [Chlamydomonas schloesseri]|uniref:Uncharacterized protein n=1 Tax=Chlamydomonas schloesseri TaxID=2026947 RepID=A0A836B509_9CHLO|nr:hypothetical protein HYH02_007332 [Chlamydomonas schloesseri]|eukprot:KAG2447876.1 hypothetical protein HYH02_007332 [Chlamydomonas schloesseri]